VARRLRPKRHTLAGPIGSAEVRRVVLVESDQYYREVLTFELLRQGFVVHAFADGAALLGSLATAVDADLAVLDWDLPRMSGIQLLAELRQHGVNTPVVFLSGKFIAGDENDRCLLAPREALDAYECMAFAQGAADIIEKSRDRQVPVRRLRSVVELARPKANVAIEDRLACGKLLLKPETSRAYWNQVDIGLTFGEYKIVHLLVSKAGSFATYRTLYDCLRSEGFIAGTGRMAFGRMSGRRSSASATSFAPATPPSARSRTTAASDTAGASPRAKRAGRAGMGGRSSRPFHLPYRCRPAPGAIVLAQNNATLAPWQT
jgi:two-component system response regulator ChvI